MWKVGSEQQSIKMDPLDWLDQLRVPKYGFTSTKPYFSFWESSGGLWGALQTHIAVFEGKKAPVGALKTKISLFGGKKAPAGALQDVYRFFEEKKAPAGALQDVYRFFEDNSFCTIGPHIRDDGAKPPAN